MANRIIGQLYGIDDFVIIPEKVTAIKSRTKECTAKYNSKSGIFKDKFPLFAAPMSCVIDDTNWQEFMDSGVLTVIPRTVSFEKRCELIHSSFIAVGLNEFNALIHKSEYRNLFNETSYVCVDIANGHMSNMLALCAEAKQTFGETLVLMAGNIANPSTYFDYARAGIDFVRCSIGSGNVCTTASNTGVHYPLGSLLLECRKNKEMLLEDSAEESNYLSVPEIVADGGFRNFDQIIKALAIGADYCMVGSLFAKTFSACGKLYSEADGGMTDRRGNWIPLDLNTTITNFGGTILSSRCFREYYGMSTKKAQMAMGKTEEECRTSEGVVRYVQVDVTLESWLENFEHYLKSSMSYCNCTNLEEFIGFPMLGINTPMARSAFAK